MTTIEPDLTQVSFHEATIAGIARKAGTVKLTLSDVRIGGIQRAAEVAIDGIIAILRDGSPVESFSMEKEDGEILTLRQQDGRIELAVQWNDFAARSQDTVVYSLLGQKIALHIKSIVER